jgi:alkylation response protein AidB-like acyl-CoA dehydrogenase
MAADPAGGGVASVACGPGGGFLLAPAGSERIRTPDDFTAEQRAFYRTGSEFALARVVANGDRIERKDYPFLRQLLREAGELGLLGLHVPEAYGGLAQDETSSLLVTEAMARLGSWSVTFGAQTGIGTLPIVYFGTPEQKARYLPRLVSGEWVAAYALSEASSGSDALGARTRAVRSADGRHWILNGAKQWISNAAFADVFIVFAKVDGERFTAFVVDRDTPGFSVGAEERKMGIRGSSTCALAFDDAKVPIRNLLGEVGKGHRIAFNILNIGRLKLGAGCVAGCRGVLEVAVRYGRERRAFGQAITEFGLIREKLARMAALVYVGEAMSYRTSGLVDARVGRSGAPRGSTEHDADVVAAVEEYSIEASILKVWGSEALGWAADEALQIHGGYGFVEEYPIERVYRDVRVNRIFEGTNEINRMLVPGTLLKRAMKGQFPLLDVARTVSEAVERGELPRPAPGPLARERRMADLTKAMFVHALQAAIETFGPALPDRQEVLGALADVAMEAYALDSAVARATQSAGREARIDPVAEACVRLYALEGHERAYDRARRALRSTLTDTSACRARLAGLARLLDDEPCDVVALREAIVAATLDAGRYPLAWA